jgi:hypothetical protein
MSRDLSDAAIDASSAEVVLRTVAAELDFSSGVVRVNGSPASVIIGGQEFFGVGGLGSISQVDESTELKAYGLTMTLSGVPRDMIGTAVAENYQGRRATLWEVILDRETWAVIADPIVFFRGRMSQMNVDLGTTATVELVVENRLARWETPKIRRYTDEDQQRAHPGDKGLAFVASTTEKTLIWPARSFRG